MTKHLDHETVYALLDGELDAAAEGRAEAHLLRCPECRAAREECGAVLASLRWYAAAPPPPPAGYWDGFWDRFAARVEGTPGSVDARPIRSGRAEPARGIRPWLAPALATAAALALLVGSWWGSGALEEAASPTVASVPAVPSRASVVQTGWESDVEFFERATVAVGGVDPMSKGLVLVALSESR